MKTLTLPANKLTKGDRLPEFTGTVQRVAIRESGTVEVWFTEDHLAPLGFNAETYPHPIQVERR